MSAISPGTASNSGGLETRTTDAIRGGKEKLGFDSSNGSASMSAHTFELRVASDPGH